MSNPNLFNHHSAYVNKLAANQMLIWRWQHQQQLAIKANRSDKVALTTYHINRLKDLRL